LSELRLKLFSSSVMQPDYFVTFTLVHKDRVETMGVNLLRNILRSF